MKRRGVAGTVEEDDRGEQHGNERGGEADVEVGVVADDSDEGRGDGVAEGVDDEELAGERGGADLGTNGVDGGGVDGASHEEDQEDGGGEAIQGEGVGAEEAEQRGRNRDGCADGGDEVESFGVGAGPLLRDGSTGDGAAEAGDDGDRSHDVGGRGLRAAIDALEEGWHPPGDAAEREGDGRVAEDGGEIGFVLEEGEDGSLLQPGFFMLAGSAGGFAHEGSDEERDKDSGNRGDDEGHAPAEVFADGAADEVAECGADGDGDVEDGEDTIALVGFVKICEERWSKDAEAGFAYA